MHPGWTADTLAVPARAYRRMMDQDWIARKDSRSAADGIAAVFRSCYAAARTGRALSPRSTMLLRNAGRSDIRRSDG